MQPSMELLPDLQLLGQVLLYVWQFHLTLLLRSFLKSIQALKHKGQVVQLLLHQQQLEPNHECVLQCKLVPRPLLLLLMGQILPNN